MVELVSEMVNTQAQGSINYPISSGVVVCVPAHNEGYSISDVISQSKRYVSNVIVCDDGSIDNTSSAIRESGGFLISNKEKMGKGYTLRTLFKESLNLDPDIIITLDGDNQHSPSDIPTLLNEIVTNGYDIVVGSRFVPGAETDISMLRLLGLTLINTIQRILTNSKVKDSQSGFRAFNREAFCAVLESKEDGYAIESEELFIAASKGLKVKEVPITIRYKGLHSTSKKHFILHGFELVAYIIKYAYNERFKNSS